ncbi:MAG: hypothetical protein ACRESZ_09585 [Methylococcales bacterium]
MPGNPQTILVRSILIAIALSLSSCATQKQAIEKGPASKKETEESEISTESTFKAPPRSTFKNGRKLKLVRIMEGGACNSRDEGVRGLFLVYAEPGKIERANEEKGQQMSEQFENDVTNLSLQALQEAIDTINIADNPFALDIEDTLQQIVDRLISKFSEFVQPAIEQFESNTNQTIDVIPFSQSMNFILEACNAVLNESTQSP